VPPATGLATTGLATTAGKAEIGVRIIASVLLRTW
jgi:hypothetical protein